MRRSPLAVGTACDDWARRLRGLGAGPRSGSHGDHQDLSTVTVTASAPPAGSDGDSSPVTATIAASVVPQMITAPPETVRVSTRTKVTVTAEAEGDGSGVVRAVPPTTPPALRLGPLVTRRSIEAIPGTGNTGTVKTTTWPANDFASLQTAWAP